MSRKSTYLQVRVSPEQKAVLRRRAARVGSDLSSYVLARALPPEEDRLERILAALEDEEVRPFALAALNDLLSDVSATRFREVMAGTDVASLSDLMQNYVAAMVEQAAKHKGVEPPRWTAGIEPLAEPYFVTPLRSLRLHLLKNAPVAFKRRNIFVDASVGDRV